MLHLTERERISLLMMRGWGDRLRSYNDVKQLFNATFWNENTSISKSMIHKTIRRFEEIGGVKNHPQTGRPAIAINPEKSLDILFFCGESTYFHSQNSSRTSNRKR